MKNVLVLCLVCGLCYVDASFQSPMNFKSFPEDVVIEKWNISEYTVKNMVSNLMKSAISKVIDSDIELSDDCSQSVLELLFGLRDLKLWAVKMFDAIGKPQAGIFRMSPTSLGNYDECLSIEAENVEIPFLGQYCILDFWTALPEKPKLLQAHLVPEGFRNLNLTTDTFRELLKLTPAMYVGSLRFGLCVPSTCTKGDLQTITDYALDMLQMNGDIFMCETIKTREFPDQTTLILIGVLGGIVVLVMLATAIDVINDLRDVGSKGKSQALGDRIIVAFSMRSNFVKLFTNGASTSDDKLKFFGGMRFFSLLWIVVGHTYNYLEPHTARNLIFYVHKMITNLPFHFILNTHLAVPTFLFITAVIFSYHLIRAYDDKGPRVFHIPMLIFHRLVRLQPMLMLSVAIMIIMPYVGSGPIWYDIVVTESEICKKNWWRSLLLINNYTPFGESCLIHTWYVATDMQLFLFAIVYFFIYFKNAKIGTVFALIAVASSIISAGVVTYVNNFPPTMLPGVFDKTVVGEMLNKGHFTFHVNMASYFIAILLGTYLAKNPKLNISPFAQVIGWCLAIVCNCYCLYAPWLWSPVGHVPGTTESVLYAALHRSGWALGLAWLTLMCFYGRGGYITGLLSWSGYALVNRLSFLVYLFHVPVIYYYAGTLRGEIDMSYQQTAWSAGGTLCITLMVATVIRLFFESPIVLLEKILLSPSPKKDKEVQENVENGTTISKL